MSEMVDISGLEKADVLAALYNNTRQLGLGFAHSRGALGMTREEAAEEIKHRGLDHDYLHGRVMKVDLSQDTFKPALYDRDNGEGEAARVVANLRQTGSVDRI